MKVTIKEVDLDARAGKGGTYTAEEQDAQIFIVKMRAIRARAIKDGDKPSVVHGIIRR